MTGAPVGPRRSADEARVLADFAQGRSTRLWEALGARRVEGGARFGVWAPHARSVSVIGDWNDWSDGRDPLVLDADDGVWLGTVAGVEPGSRYRFSIVGPDGASVHRGDPLALAAEQPHTNTSVLTVAGHRWQDRDWVDRQTRADLGSDRLAIYEVHLGSWRPGADGAVGYAEVAEPLAAHVRSLGFTHVELLPVAEHPYGGSWGYQVTGYYAPTARYGTPDDFRAFVDTLHAHGIGVILDWVPAHFPDDDGALAHFDGASCFERDDPARARHPDWGTLEFDLSKPQVRSFLLANADYWLREFHVDGLRVDAVASLLYLDYSRAPGEWTPNVHGGNEDLDAVRLLQDLTSAVRADHPGKLLVAEESTTWPGVTAPVAEGGLGFTHKWNLGWMHDTLDYFSRPPSDRAAHQDELTFSLSYAGAERWVLPLSHDEVVHLKRSLLSKMPEPHRFAQLRALYGWMWAHPGAKLLFMGGELGEEHEWADDRWLDWDAADAPERARLRSLVAAVNQVAARERSLWAGDESRDGFSWINGEDTARSVLSILRTDPHGGARPVACVGVFGTEPIADYRIGVPVAGPWEVLLDTSLVPPAGSGKPALEAVDVPWHGFASSVVLERPAPSVLWLAPAGAT